jgi:gliding motility-associated-like protein
LRTIVLIPSESTYTAIRVLKKHSRLVRLSWFLIVFSLLSAKQAAAQAPVAQFTANTVTGCSPVTVSFQDQSTGTPRFWNWDLGNGQLSNVQNPVGVYTTPGTYTVTLVVSNADGTHGITKTNYITVNPSPIGSFTSNITTGCLPVDIQFTDQSTPQAGTIVSWRWNFGDGNTSTQQNPQHTYTATGFYTVSLVVTSSTGCTGSAGATNYIRIVPGVKAEFSNSTPVTCQGPFQTTFTNLTSGPGSMTYQWDFGNSTGSTQTSPPATYAAAGTYNVTLIAQSQYGCSDTIQKPVTINGSGTSFTGPDTVCLNSNVNFQNTSSPAPASALWDFGNGIQSTLIHGSTTYASAGNYTVKLVNNYANCTDSMFKTVTVMPQPTVNFTANNFTACKAPFTVNFQDLSPDAAQWLWDFGDGNTSTQQNPQHTYTTEGQFNVRLIITTRNGCRDTLMQPNFIRIVKADLKVTNLPAGVCVGQPFSPLPNVTTIDGVASWFWDFGHNGATSNAQFPTYTYTDSGTYTVKLRITSNGGCVDSIVFTDGMRTGPQPNVNFTFTTTDTCAASLVQFTDLSFPADEWAWNFGDNSPGSSQQHPTHAFTDTGTFQVILTAFNHGCARSFIHPTPIHIKPPIANFTYTVPCANKLQAVFTNTSKTDPGYGAISYAWNFGDGSPVSTQQTPSHTYAGLGNYNVTLTTTNGACSHSVTLPVKLVGDVADFSISKTAICIGESVSFTAINSNPLNILLYEWSVDGGTQFVTGPGTFTTSFSSQGTYNIALRITDINNCQSTKTITAAVSVSGPKALFAASGVGACRNTPVTFNDLSIPGGSNIVKWTFLFGDNTTQTFTAPPFTHAYADTGMFDVQLTVEDVNGCTSAFTVDNIVITKPVAGFSSGYSTICPLTSLPFTDTSAGIQLQYAWDFGDGNTSTLQHPTHNFGAADSSYNVKLVITDTSGCKDSVTHTILVRAPKPAFDIKDTTTICPPIETWFTFRGQDYETFLWDFGDGGTSTLTNPTHFYNSYGSYTATLILTGYGGCTASASMPVNVYNPYSVTNLTYSPVTACNELLVDFTITTPPSTRFTFYYGDGELDTTQTKVFQHFYKSPAYYTPSLLLTDSVGCQVGIAGPTRIDIIGAIPLFGVDKKSFCDSGTVYFTNYTLGNDPIVSRVWDFGDGNTTGTLNPVHTYTLPGTYLASQTVTTQTGCSKTITDTIRIYGTPYAQIQGDTIACINELLPLHGALNVPDTAIVFTWNLGNGSNSDVQNPSVRYTAAGNYTVRLETANKLNCKSTTSRGVYVPPDPVITIAADPVMPVGSSIPIPVVYSDNIATYVWTPATTLSCADCPNPVASPKSTTKYNVKVQDIYGCESNRDITVVVVCNDYNYFMPNTFSPNGDGINDIFAPRGRGLARVGSLRIFNRWGELVFEKKNFVANDRTPTGGWDGTYKGKPAIADTYVYIVEFICENSAVIPFKGNVTLIR